jgi:DNA/RNA-binding protein KIN17
MVRFGTKRVLANRVYQEYISDKSHLHMNSTRWVTLTEFVKHLGRTGVARVDETEKGWFIAWIDNSPQALAKQVCFHPITTLNNLSYTQNRKLL